MFKVNSLNNKGYMLVEIILAFSIAMVIMFFITELTIKLKNKNDDLLVKTLVATDQAIIYNTLMVDAYNGTLDCSSLSVSGKTFKYGSFTNIVNDYTTVKLNSCSNSGGVAKVDISLDVRQLKNENFDVVINHSSTVTNNNIRLYTCSKSAAITKQINCSASNYGKEQNACSDAGYNYSSDNCGRYNYLRRIYEVCTLDAGVYKFKSSGYEDGVTTCETTTFTCNSSKLGTSKVVGCEKLSSYYYTGKIQCSKNSCSSGTLKNGQCYLYNQESCPSGWTAY